jgi:hypothetical protein
MSETQKHYTDPSGLSRTFNSDKIIKYSQRMRTNPSKVYMSKTNDFNESQFYNSHFLSQQSQQSDKIPASSKVLGDFQIVFIVVSSVIILCVLGFYWFRRRRKDTVELPSILLESNHVMPEMTPMQEGLRDSIDFTRSEMPVPYILPPSQEFDSFLKNCSSSLKTKVSKPLSTVTADSQDSLGRFYKS